VFRLPRPQQVQVGTVYDQQLRHVLVVSVFKLEFCYFPCNFTASCSDLTAIFPSSRRNCGLIVHDEQGFVQKAAFCRMFAANTSKLDPFQTGTGSQGIKRRERRSQKRFNQLFGFFKGHFIPMPFNYPALAINDDAKG